MKRFINKILFIAAGAAAGANASGTSPDPLLKTVVDGPQRSEDARSRDVYRHPLEVLTFFGLKADAKVIEIWPANGYWTEILAPYLRDKGHYTAGVGGKPENLKKFQDRFGAQPKVFGTPTIIPLDMAAPDLGPAAAADAVLTFRNVHNWMKADKADAMLAAFAKALKPGGLLGLEEHRARTDKPQDPKAESGYVREDYVIELAKKAGFAFVAKSEVNANPKDTKDYAQGVWTLPPTMRLGDADKARYLAIGESDRMILLFKKTP